MNFVGHTWKNLLREFQEKYLAIFWEAPLIMEEFQEQSKKIPYPKGIPE